jgi:hypothetical protein
MATKAETMFRQCGKCLQKYQAFSYINADGSTYCDHCRVHTYPVGHSRSLLKSISMTLASLFSRLGRWIMG